MRVSTRREEQPVNWSQNYHGVMPLTLTTIVNPDSGILSIVHRSIVLRYVYVIIQASKLAAFERKATVLISGALWPEENATLVEGFLFEELHDTSLCKTS